MINWILRQVTPRVETYANWRGGVIKNGGAIGRICGHIVCHIYVIVNDDGGTVLILKKGLLAHFLAKELQHCLMKHFYSVDDDKRDFYWNELDSIY